MDNSFIQELTGKLSSHRTQWDEAVRQFLATYQMECDDWLNQNPQWANILANALPRQSEIARRFNFGWQVFNIIPAPTDTLGDQTQDELDIVPTRAIEKMARSIEEVQEVYAPGKTFRAGPLRRLAGMARSLSFSSPEVDKLAELLGQIADTGNLDIVQIMMGKLADPKELAALCVPSKTPQDILDSVVTINVPQPQPMPTPVQEKKEPVAKSLPDIGSLLADAQSVLNHPLVRVPQVSEPEPQVTPAEEQMDPVTAEALKAVREVQRMPEYKPAPAQPVQVSVPQANEQAMVNMLGTIDSEGLW